MTQPGQSVGYAILVHDGSDYVTPEDSKEWWLKGVYEAESPEAAIGKAYSDYWGSKPRTGNLERIRLAVAGPDVGWAEFDVEIVHKQPVLTGVKPR